MLGSSNVVAEGTKQWSPNATDKSALRVNNGGSYVFAGYGVASNRRLHIHIKDPANEIVYIGLGRQVSGNSGNAINTTYTFQVRAPNGAGNTIVHGPHTVSTPNLTSYNIAVAGPSVISAGGYSVSSSMWVFDPAVAGKGAGDYYIEFSPATIEWFDITVATKGASPTAIDGRVWSQAWAVRANDGSGGGYFDKPFNGSLVAYDGEYATKIDFNNSGIRPLEGQFSFNRRGTGSSGNKGNDRKSVNGANSGNPEHKIFLNLPDPVVYPLQAQGTLENLPLKITNIANPMIPIEVTQAGQVELLLDFDGNGVFTNNLDVRLFADVVVGVNQIAWNGKNAQGVVIQPEDYPIVTKISYTQGETHFTAYDTEGLDNGFQVFTHTSTGTVGPRLQFWDDANIPDSPGSAGSSDVQVNVDDGAVTRRRWNNNNYGDLNTINTWWYAYREAQTTTILFPDSDYGDAPNDGIDFNYGIAQHIIPDNDGLVIGAKKAEKEEETEILKWTKEWTTDKNKENWFKENKEKRKKAKKPKNDDKNKKDTNNPEDYVDPRPVVTGDGEEEDGLAVTAYTWENNKSCTGLLPNGTTGTITMSEKSYCITAKASNTSSVSGQFVAWIDFNQNGVFDDPAERSVVEVDADPSNDDTQGNVPAGTNNADVVLYWQNLDKLSGDLNTFIRMRFTSDPEFKSNNSPDPIGVAINGEVEDTALGINVVGTDYGDAPASYGDASHVIELNAYMGTTIDNEVTSQNTANAGTDGTGDDVIDTVNHNYDDDDGVASLPSLRTDSSSYSLDVIVTSPTTVDANLVGWIDFDNNGTFDSDEAATVAVPQNTTETAVTLTWASLPADTVAADTYIRLRLTTDTSIATGTASTSVVTGLASDGEVEDYKLSILRPFSSYVCPAAKADFWFANDESGSVSTAEFRDALDFLYQISDEFIYDNTTGVKAGITGWGSNVASAEVLIPIDELFADPGDSGLISTTTVITNGNGKGLRELYDKKKNTSTGTRLDFATTYLAGLINAGNGRRTGVPQISVLLTDASSSQLTNARSGGGSNWITAANALRSAGPDGTRLIVIITEEAATAYNNGAAKATVDAVVGNGKLIVVPTYSDAADPTKLYIDEVVKTVCATVDPQLDFGDAADSYTDASHDIFYASELFLGAVVPDQDTDTQNTANASVDSVGDDNDGGDDEEGLTMIAELTDIDDSYSLDVVVTNNRGSTAQLVGWLDNNSNGIFETSEATTVAVNSGTTAATVTLTWSGLASTIQAGNSQIRLRLTTDSSVATGDASTSLMGGKATDGEVEDYALTIKVGGFPVKGRVYKDTNVNATNDAAEKGVSSFPVVLVKIEANPANNTCVSTKTKADGSYTFFPVIPGNYQLYEASRETTPVPRNCGVTNAKDPTGYRSTTASVLAQFSVVDAEITGKDFGNINDPTFTPDQSGTVLAGNVVFYPHIFTPKSTGTVNFTTINTTPITSGWSSITYQDSNCNNKLDGTEANAPIGSNIVTIANTAICLINKVSAPTNVADGEGYSNVISAVFDFNANALAGNTTLKVTDLTKAAANDPDPVVGSSKLELRKTVQNTTQNTAETETKNQAKPGDVLTYRVYYSNTGSGVITDLKVNDTVPAFTVLRATTASCDTTPTDLTCTPDETASPSIKWRFTGTLKGGAKGLVSYDVQVE